MILLALDTAHHAHTGVYTLYNVRKGLSFTFYDPDALNRFTAFWYKNPIAAMFAYKLNERKNHV